MVRFVVVISLMNVDNNDDDDADVFVVRSRTVISRTASIKCDTSPISSAEPSNVSY